MEGRDQQLHETVPPHGAPGRWLNCTHFAEEETDPIRSNLHGPGSPLALQTAPPGLDVLCAWAQLSLGSPPPPPGDPSGLCTLCLPVLAFLFHFAEQPCPGYS